MNFKLHTKNTIVKFFTLFFLFFISVFNLTNFSYSKYNMSYSFLPFNVNIDDAKPTFKVTFNLSNSNQNYINSKKGKIYDFTLKIVENNILTNKISSSNINSTILFLSNNNPLKYDLIKFNQISLNEFNISIIIPNFTDVSNIMFSIPANTIIDKNTNYNDLFNYELSFSNLSNSNNFFHIIKGFPKQTSPTSYSLQLYHQQFQK